MDEGPPPVAAITRLRWYATSLPVQTVFAYCLMAALAVALGYGSSFGGWSAWVAAAASLALFIALGCLVIAWLLFEDDWWNDTMWEQTTAGILALPLHLVALPVAWLWGRSLDG